MTTWTTTKGTKIEYRDGRIYVNDMSAKVLAIRPAQGMLIAEINGKIAPVEVSKMAQDAVFSDFTARCDAWKTKLTTLIKAGQKELQEAGRHVREVEEMSRNGFIK